MSAILIHDARILTMDAADTEYPKADILIEGKLIKAVGQNLTARPDAHNAQRINGSGLLAMPGLINGHFHSPGNFMRGAVPSLPLEVFMLYEVPPLSKQSPSGRMNYVRTMLSSMEMLRNGVTAVFDDAFHVPVPTVESIDGLMESYRDSGLRATVTLDQPNALEFDKYPFLYDILPEDQREALRGAPRQSCRELVELYTHLIEKWNNAEEGRLGAGVSCSAPQRVTTDYFTALSELSRAHDIPFAIHILETKLQRVLGEEKFGKSLIKYVRDLGFLDKRMEVIHSIWVDDDDMDMLAEAKCTVSHQPLCNLRIGSGIMPFRRMRDRSIPICLGTDEACSDDAVNLWNVIKMCGCVHTITDPDYRNWPQPDEILRCVFSGGARAMLRSGRIGSLAPGYEADLILLDLNTSSFTPLNDLRSQLVFCENGSSVVMTMVAGKIVFDHGQFLTVNEEDIKAEARELMRKFSADIEQCRTSAAVLEPFYREMYLKCAKRDVGMNRWANERYK